MLQLTYPDTASLAEKIRTVAQRIYGAADITLEPQAAKQLAHFEAAGFGALPVCMAKTQYSFSTNPEARGAPTGFTIPVREIRLCGAEFVVALCGDIMTMPGLPRVPASDGIHLDADRNIVGLL